MGFETAKEAGEVGTTKGMQRFKTSGDETEELTADSDLQSSVAKDVQQLKSAKADDFENLKSKISFMDSKLEEVGVIYFISLIQVYGGYSA